VSYTGSIPDTTSRDGDWRDFAACRREEPELFFPKGKTGPWQLVIAEAKSVCRRCPVVDECLQWALEAGTEFGVWGGRDEDERRTMRARRTRRPEPEPEDEPETHDDAQQYAALYAQHTQPAEGGHLIWAGPAPTVNVDGKHVAYTRLAFEVGTGEPPYGPVKAGCDRYRCVAPEHLTDATIRAARKAAV
jgi:WhiB family redox-sensing transcriptional regulator